MAGSCLGASTSPGAALPILSISVQRMALKSNSSTLDASPRSIEAYMECRPGRVACCIAPSISSAIAGMPNGEPPGNGVSSIDDANRFFFFGRPERPAVVGSLQPSESMCDDPMLFRPVMFSSASEPVRAMRASGCYAAVAAGGGSKLS